MNLIDVVCKYGRLDKPLRLILLVPVIHVPFNPFCNSKQIREFSCCYPLQNKETCHGHRIPASPKALRAARKSGSASVRLTFFIRKLPNRNVTASLLLDIDPIGMVRGKVGSSTSGPLDQYVNDRPYVASSFLSVAIAKVFGSAMKGKCKQRPELVDSELPLKILISVLPCRSGEDFLRQLFEPLGYKVNVEPHIFDSTFKEWGQSFYYTVELEKLSTLKEVLTHLYVLIPVLDNNKHYYVGEAELENLLAKGDGWLSEHPKKEIIAKRYLKHRISLARQALTQAIG